MQDGSTTGQKQGSSNATDTVCTLNGNIDSLRREDLPHITDRFIPISHIVSALARTAYIDLVKLRQALIDAPDQKRKKKFVDYASRYRAEVVKVLVLVNWATRAEEVSTAIDLRAWLQGQKNCYDNLYGLLRFDISRTLESAKIIEPDIPTAIDVLITGNVSQLRYSETAQRFHEPKPLDQKAILQILKTVNALLSLRLTLHEVLPAKFQNYKIDSGRVTFEVTNEFSVDLFFATEAIEDPKLQWFMIDFRFDFTAEDHLETPLSLKLNIESVSNALMASTLSDEKGKHQLVELYNFLHSFTIQYKLERLFSQFSTIGTREKGRIDVKYSSAQKVLAVGFWLQKRHKDRKRVLNSLTVTIEAPVMTAKDKFLSTERFTNDYNRERLQVVVRQAEEEQSLGGRSIEEHSAATLLATVVSNRISLLLDRIHQQLTHAETAISSTLSPCQLRVDIMHDDFLMITVNEHSGDYLVSRYMTETKFTCQRPRQSIELLQSRLNQLSSPKDIALCIADFRLNHIKREFERVARSASWVVHSFTPAAIHQDEFFRAFGQTRMSLSSCLFLTRPHEGWKDINGGASWFVVVNCQATVKQVWLAEFTVDDLHAKWKLQWLEPIHFGTSAGNKNPEKKLDFAIFKHLWRFCTARITCLQMSRALMERCIEHHQVPAIPESSVPTIPSIVFPVKAIVTPRRPWTEPVVQIDILRVCQDSRGGALVSFKCQKLSTLELDLSGCEDAEFRADKRSSYVSFNFKATIAQDAHLLLDQFRRKWLMVENTIGMVSAASRIDGDYVLQTFTLNSASFLYENKSHILQIQQQPSLLDDSMQLSVSMGSVLKKHNPQLRIAEYLSPLATRYQTNMQLFFKIFHMTLPVLKYLYKIEQDTFQNPSFYIITRSVATYRICYPDKSVVLLIRARPAPKAELLAEPYKKIANSIVWHFTDGSRSSLPISGSVLIDSCEEIFTRGLNELLQTGMTFPEGSGIACSVELADRVLAEVHKTIMQLQRSTRPPSSSIPVNNKPNHINNQTKKKLVTTGIDSFAGQNNHNNKGNSEVIEIS